MLRITQGLFYFLAAICFAVAAINQDCSGIPEACVCLGLGSFVEALGVLANNRKMICCFYIWTISNLISAAIHWQLGSMSLLIRDVVFIALAAEGICKWRKEAADAKSA